jgi:hypothetical protein
MRNLFAALGLFVTALTAACGSSSHPKVAPDGGMSGGAVKGDGAAEVGSRGGATGTGGTQATGTGGVAGSDALVATGGTGARAAGGTTGTGGVTGAGGRSGTGGTTGTGGVTGTGGRSGTGGTTGSGGTSGIAAPADNVAEVSVDFGLPNIGYVNGLFATVTVCVPGTSQCQTIDHVLVDTGSTGLRLLQSVVTLSLPAWTDDSGVALAQCTQFVSSFTWGALWSADLRIAGEQANNLAIQLIDESAYPVPSDCTGTSSNTADTLGSNGIIGVGSFLQDCGAACAAPVGSRSANPGMYYACSSTKKGGCQAAAVPVSKQLWNPVALFSQDNNGTIIELPAVAAAGAASVTGALVFGIGTRDNNGLGQATVLPLDGAGTFLTRYPANGNNSLAFVDSGSNAIYFLDSGTTRIPACTGSYSYFYCPSSTKSLSATNQDVNGLVTMTVNFSIANAKTLLARQANVVFGNLGGPSITPSSGGTGMGAYFDWGLPFYFGRNVFTSIEGQSTPLGTELFVAF